ncbi:MAG: anion permease, partial [Pseudomonadota bacterium]
GQHEGAARSNRGRRKQTGWSGAFMLPVATAPNAIIYATDKVPIGQMIQRGVRINLIGILIITAIGFWLAPLVL